jgi:hypothetical protein
MVDVGRRLVVWGLVWLLGLAGLRVTLLAPEICPPLRADDAHAAAVAAADWIARNQAPDGTYLYELTIGSDGTLERSTGYNTVRHAGATMALYQMLAAGADGYLPAADAGMEWMRSRLVGDGALRAVGDSTTTARLGTTALLAVGLAHRRLATGDTRYDELMVQAGRFIEAMQRSDGSMLESWDIATGRPIPGRTSLYFTGESLWALTLLAEAFPGQGWDELAYRTLEYIATDRDEDEDVWPRPWADQWAAYSLAQMAPWGLSETHLGYARLLAAQYGMAVRWESQRNDGITGLVHAPESIAAGQGTWLEGLGALEKVAATDARFDSPTGTAEALGDRLVCTAGRMLDKQINGTGVPELDGAFFVHRTTRVDGQQHVLGGLLFAEQLLREREERSRS